MKEMNMVEKKKNLNKINYGSNKIPPTLITASLCLLHFEK
jgi:hypothetical protein